MLMSRLITVQASYDNLLPCVKGVENGGALPKVYCYVCLYCVSEWHFIEPLEKICLYGVFKIRINVRIADQDE